MSMSPWVGWGITTLASYFLNKPSRSESDSDPEELTIAETKTGTPIPVIMGRTLLKSPLVIYYGDFRAKAYTETYAAHANFSAWPLVFSLIMNFIAAPASGHQATPGAVTATGANSAGPVHSTGESSGATYKDDLTGPLLNALFTWLLMWLINGRNLHTTIQKGFKYSLGYQMLWAWSGPGARIRGLYMDKYDSGTGNTAKGIVWAGDEAREAHPTDPFVIAIDDEELFGGPDEQGGFAGEFHVFLGGAGQLPDPWMVEQMQADSIQTELRGLTPAYRPYLSTVVPTAYVGKSATVPSTWLDYQWIPNRLGLGPIGDDANPAEVIYEIYVNADWGMNESPDTVNAASLLAMGQTLREEGLGITVNLSTLTKGETVIDAILEHINGVRYQEPTTGKWTYKLIRDDYDLSKLPVLDESNISSISYTRLDWQETIGEVSVTYSDRNAQYEENSVQDNDPAVIEINGNSKTTKSYDYTYFTLAVNALWAAKREGKQQGYPLATASVTGNRTLSAIRIGDVALLNFKPYGISGMAFRVTDVDIGTLEDGKVQLELMEDVFSLGKTIFDYSGSTGWNPGKTAPAGVNDYRFMELPYELMPDKNSYVFAMANQPNADTVKWTVWRNYNGAWAATTSMTQWTAVGRLVYDYSEFTDAVDMAGLELVDLGGLDKLLSSLLSDGSPDLTSARRGGKILFLGDEVMAWSSIEKMANGHYLLKGMIRGAYDTMPRAHGAGDLVYFFDNTTCANVTTGGPVCLAGNTVSEFYTITTASVDEAEEFNTLQMKSLTTCRRAERPSPPGRLRLTCFSQPNQIHLAAAVGDMALVWVDRNKELQTFGVATQDDTREYWTGLDYALPAGASYLLKVLVGGAVVGEYPTAENGLTYTWAQRCKDSDDVDGETVLQLYTVKDGLESYQPQERSFLWKVPPMVDACLTLDDCMARLVLWADTDRIVIPENAYTVQRQIFYNEMPIFILGDQTTQDDPDAVLNYNGEYIHPNGQIAVVTGQNGYMVNFADSGYKFRGYFMPEQSGGNKIYAIGG